MDDRSHRSRKKPEAAGPFAEECAVLASRRPRRSHGRHHVAHRGQETADTRQDGVAAAPAAQARSKSTKPRSPRCRTGSRNCSASNSSRRMRSRNRRACSASAAQDPSRQLPQPTATAHPARTPGRPDSRPSEKARLPSLFASNVALSYRTDSLHRTAAEAEASDSAHPVCARGQTRRNSPNC